MKNSDFSYPQRTLEKDPIIELFPTVRAMLASDPLYITPEDYLAAAEISPIRHEYRDGEVFAMTDGTLRVEKF